MKRRDNNTTTTNNNNNNNNANKKKKRGRGKAKREINRSILQNEQQIGKMARNSSWCINVSKGSMSVLQSMIHSGIATCLYMYACMFVCIYTYITKGLNHISL